ncbi:hypothetical protein GCM10028895_11270 [Pontibacter rugosus]
MAKETNNKATAEAADINDNAAKAATAETPVAPAKKTSTVEAAQEQVTSEMVHLIVFKLGTEEYAIKIDQVKEVTSTPAVTRMPRTPDFVKGVANIRGDIIAIMDMERRFGIRPLNSMKDYNQMPLIPWL